MYLRCTACDLHDLGYLAKRMSQGYYPTAHPSAVPALEAWFDKHAYCGDTQDHFEVTYEMPANWDCGKGQA